MKPGRELDALIAEKVFGYRTYKTNNPFDYWGKDKNVYLMSVIKKENGVETVEETKRYSTDIAAAWGVVEKVTEIGSVYKAETPLWGVGLPGVQCATGVTAPHAICLAALGITDGDTE